MSLILLIICLLLFVKRANNIVLYFSL